MPKGRIFAPATEHDGIWFNHRGLPDTGPAFRETSTTTGLMLTGPYNPDMASYPPVPPDPFMQKHTRNFKLTNNYSNHDNRHSFQDHGVYFGNGRNTRHLGKQNLDPTQRQHHTAHDYLKHKSLEPIDHDYHTIYHADYQGAPTAHPPTRRRFPKIHKDGDPGLAELTSTTTSWYNEKENSFRTPLHVLAVSQEPFLPVNKWKYSYHGLPKCYPTYNTKEPHRAFPKWVYKQPPHPTSAPSI